MPSAMALGDVHRIVSEEMLQKKVWSKLYSLGCRQGRLWFAREIQRGPGTLRLARASTRGAALLLGQPLPGIVEQVPLLFPQLAEHVCQVLCEQLGLRTFGRRRQSSAGGRKAAA